MPVVDSIGVRAMALQPALHTTFVTSELSPSSDGEASRSQPDPDSAAKLLLADHHPIGWSLGAAANTSAIWPQLLPLARRLVSKIPCAPPQGSAQCDDGGEVCLRYIRPQPPPGLGVELRSWENCSLNITSSSGELWLQFGWELHAVGAAPSSPKWDPATTQGSNGAEPRNGTNPPQPSSAEQAGGRGASFTPTAVNKTSLASPAQPPPTVIALGVAVRTHSALRPDQLPLIKVFVPSLLKTIRPDVLAPASGARESVGRARDGGLRVDRNGFHYRLMLGYDAGDPTYDDPVLLSAVGVSLRASLGSAPVSVHAVRYDGLDRGAPCWVWNKMFARACGDGAS